MFAHPHTPFSEKPLVMLNEEQLQKLKESTCQVLVVYNFERSKTKTMVEEIGKAPKQWYPLVYKR